MKRVSKYIRNKKTRERNDEKMGKLQHNKGITLIALIVTIVVLLILAGVSIAVITGDNGVIKSANQAKKQSKEEEQ